jgi:hypothetical protein
LVQRDPGFDHIQEDRQLRQAKRLGLLSLIAILLVVGGTLIGGSTHAPSAAAQATGPTFTGTKSCKEPFTGGGTNNAGTPLVTDCTLTLTVTIPTGTTVPATGASFLLTDILLDTHACFVPPVQVPSNQNTPSTPSVSPCSSGTTNVSGVLAVPTAAGTLSTLCPSGATVGAPTVSATGTTINISCALPPIVVIGPTNLCEEVDLVLSFTVGTTITTLPLNKLQVCPPNPVIPPTQTSPMTGVTVTKSCTPSFAGATAGATKVTDCTLVFTTASGSQFNNGTTLEFDTITGGNAVFNQAAASGGGLTTTGCENGVGGGGILSSNNDPV